MSRSPHKVVIGLLVSLSLYSCSQSPTPASENPYANGADYPWTYTRPDTQLTSQALTPGENTLFYEPILSATNGWGPLEIDRSNGEQGPNDGRVITLNGMVYKKGLGVHAGSDVRYSLKGTGASCVRFTADIGVDDEVGSRGSVVFQVYLDGVKAYDSGTMTGSSATKRPSLDITGKQELRLIVTDAGNGKDFDHADWANPRITCVASTTGPSGTFDPGFGVAGRVAVSGVDSVVEPGDSVVVLGSDFSLKRLSTGGAVVGSGSANLAGTLSAYGVARQPDGKLVVVGQQNNAPVVVRFKTDLTLDATLGVGGVVRPVFAGTESAELRDVVVQQSGNIVLIGSASRSYLNPVGTVYSSRDFMVARLVPEGTLDATFGTAGVTFVDGTAFNSTYKIRPNDQFYAAALSPDGRIVGVGESNEFYSAAAVVRFTRDGQLDLTFLGSGGFNQYSYSTFNAVAVASDGGMYIGGSVGRGNTTSYIERRAPNGAPTATAEFRSGEAYDSNSVSSLALQTDGKVVVGAGSPSGGVLARFTPTLSQDLSFGTSGTGFVFPPKGAGDVKVDSKNRIVVTGSETIRLLP
ncbi:NPCBM/NEW2 domain-containing protein [Deinococcus koreensis]|uniref:Glycosyl hydrolase family 98 putative carbohydrate-binding module domain-containing protein n=1 Tax=Deinococcus koreensis TaxID=2054903 RepID=A0A2K3UVI4_9DEIO|nr:NPCBM/NEW2 domain-containing protein [Deinococcus koreensis]PNY80541.1 hypothetical protein CVO96_03440 [Deinococcus koreensis]